MGRFFDFSDEKRTRVSHQVSICNIVEICKKHVTSQKNIITPGENLSSSSYFFTFLLTGVGFWGAILLKSLQSCQGFSMPLIPKPASSQIAGGKFKNFYRQN